MKWILRGAAILFGLFAGLMGIVYGASELGGEVVTLHRPQADGSTSPVRVWIVEDEQGTWVEHGDPASEWYQLATSGKPVTMVRGGEEALYRAVPDPGAHARYHELRRADYGWADQVVALVTPSGSDCPGVPLRLEPAAQ